jgi:hypothetical protein
MKTGSNTEGITRAEYQAFQEAYDFFNADRRP